MCACFIYVGVATIGLLLGSLLVGSMDQAKQKEANEAQIRNCPECERARLKKSRHQTNVPTGNFDAQFNRSFARSDTRCDHEDSQNIGLDVFDAKEDHPLSEKNNVAPDQPRAHPRTTLDPLTLSHTRHMSIDITRIGNPAAKPPLRKFGGADGAFITPIDESTPILGAGLRSADVDPGIVQLPVETGTSDDKETFTRGDAAKYVFSTLRQALQNSSLIIAFGR